MARMAPRDYTPPAVTDHGDLRTVAAMAHPLLTGTAAHGAYAQEMSFSGSSAPPPSYPGTGGGGSASPGSSGTAAAHAHGHAPHHHAPYHSAPHHHHHHGHHHAPRPEQRHAHRPRHPRGFAG